MGAKVVFLSTDYVFDGTAGPYGESDDPNPINAYGRTKLAGERATALRQRPQLHRPDLLAVRPPRRELRGDDAEASGRAAAVVVVHDQVGWPAYTGHLAVGLLRLIDTAAYGIHHMAGEGSCSWYEFALEIFRQAEVVTRVMASTSDMMERPAKRPANSVLVSRRSRPIALPPWQRGLSTTWRGGRQKAPRKRSSASRRQPVLPLHDEPAPEGEEGDGAEHGEDASDDASPSPEGPDHGQDAA